MFDFYLIQMQTLSLGQLLPLVFSSSLTLAWRHVDDINFKKQMKKRKKEQHKERKKGKERPHVSCELKMACQVSQSHEAQWSRLSSGLYQQAIECIEVGSIFQHRNIEKRFVRNQDGTWEVAAYRRETARSNSEEVALRRVELQASGRMSAHLLQAICHFKWSLSY